MAADIREFHFKDGWFFARLPGGEVRIQKREPSTDPEQRARAADRIVAETIIDADSWASVVASVTPMGDVRDVWTLLRQVHDSVPVATDDESGAVAFIPQGTATLQVVGADGEDGDDDAGDAATVTDPTPAPDAPKPKRQRRAKAAEGEATA